jgi:outer membrane protein assembly factor BamE (lipoprotein component of BamABCDE complex)
MKPRLWTILLAALLAGCSGYGGGLVPGQSSIEDVRAAMGEPTMVRNLPDGDQVLWYSKLPYGRESYAARIAPDGTLVSFEQRLTPENIAKLRPNESTADDVLDILGPPYRRFQFPFKDRASWEYQLWTTPERQTLYVEFSPDNVVRAVYRLYDRDTRRGFPFD